ncbi:MAG: flippase-like domain-containing protein [Candidatus Omnitrophica bacterium]|nr:flippase-like domain-containing protein [Candidatus Omnitrophota bacterium]
MLICIGLGAGVFLILALLPERHEIAAAVGSFQWRFLPLALSLAGVNYLIRAARWHWFLLHLGTTIKVSESLSIFLIGLMLSVTPGKAGELFKAYLVKLARGVPISRTVPVVLVERLTDLSGTLVLATLSLSAVAARPWMVAMLWLFLAVGLWLITRKGWMHSLFALAGGVTGERWMGRLTRTYDSLSALLTPGPLLLGTVVSALAWFAECVSLLVILKGFGAEIGWVEATFIYTFATLAGALLFFMPGGIGGTEATMVGLLREIAHTPAAVASLATALVRVATLWFAAAIGFVALFFCPLPVAEDLDRALAEEEQAP